MKNSIQNYFTVLLFCLGTSQLMAQESSDKNLIYAILDNQIEAWNSGDIDFFMEGYWKSDQLVFVGSKGPTYGFVNTLNNYKISYPDLDAMGTLSFDILHFNQWDSQTIQLIGRFTLMRKSDQPTGFFTLLFRKINGEWVIVSDHSSAANLP